MDGSPIRPRAPTRSREAHPARRGALFWRAAMAAHPHHRHRIRHQLVARALAVARRHHRLRRGARAGRGVRADGVLPRGRVRRGHRCRRRRATPGSAWYAHTPDAPCIAICSTSQGDAVCKGCGRTVRRGAALAGDDAGREARRLAPHHAGRHGLALQPLRRARARSHRRRPPRRSRRRRLRRRADGRRAGCSDAAASLRPERAPHRAAGLAGVRRPARGARASAPSTPCWSRATRRSTWPRSRSARRPTSRSSSA